MAPDETREETHDDGPPRFAADRTLARLTRWLRLMGADVLYDAARSGPEMLTLAREQGRNFLTRDKRLLTAADALYIESHLFRDQLREVMARFPFDARRFAFTRCSSCNELLQTVTRETVMRRVPSFVYAAHEKFALCPGCDRIYWGASHLERMRDELTALGL
jgi:uncharacterized protein with PIN domain